MSFLFLQKCEDSDLIDAKPLPPCKPVNVPMEITAEMFGDIAMIADFVHTFCDLLAPRETLHISIGKYQNIDWRFFCTQSNFQVVVERYQEFLWFCFTWLL